MKGRWSGARARVLYFVLAMLVPFVVVGAMNAVAVLNHFYKYGAYLLDSGWLSYIVYRQGLVLFNPRPLGVGNHFFSFHAALVLVAGGLASHLVPLTRVDWYAVFQGLICAPLALVVPLLVPPAQRPRGLFGIVLVMLAALAFALCGQGLACMGYFHWEIFIGAGLCIMLAGLGTGRAWLATAGLGIAIAGREDGGFHAALFLAAALVCDRMGKPFPIPRRGLVALLAAALVSSVLLVLLQRVVFREGSPKLFEREYIGIPAYAHLSVSLLRTRLFRLFDETLFILLPIAATVVIAAIRRDIRYLFGYLATTPWLLLHFFAFSEIKAGLGIYFGFPFLAAMTWVGAYGVARSGGAPLKPLVLFSLVALASSAGARISFGNNYRAQLLSMVELPTDTDVPAVRAFTALLHDDINRSSRWILDPSVAALGIDWYTRATAAQLEQRNSHSDYDGLALFWPTFFAPNNLQVIVDGAFTECWRLPKTKVRFCGRKGVTPPPGFVPAPLFVELLETRAGRNDGHLAESPPTEKPEIAFFGPLIPLVAGQYKASFDIRRKPCPPSADRSVQVEAFRWATQEWFAKGTIGPDDDHLELDFKVTKMPKTENSELRLYTGQCGYIVDNVSITSVFDE